MFQADADCFVGASVEEVSASVHEESLQTALIEELRDFVHEEAFAERADVEECRFRELKMFVIDDA
jgi:hypothetical protein